MVNKEIGDTASPKSGSAAGENVPSPEDTPPAPPDGGWGWVVTFSSFMTSFLVDGVCFTFGLLFSEFLDYFGESKGKTSLLGSVLNGAYLSLGMDNIGVVSLLDLYCDIPCIKICADMKCTAFAKITYLNDHDSQQHAQGRTCTV